MIWLEDRIFNLGFVFGVETGFWLWRERDFVRL